jgi:hypothetical protein
MCGYFSCVLIEGNKSGFCDKEGDGVSCGDVE